MWYSESHPSQKPTRVSYDEFLNITYPVAEDVGAAGGVGGGERPKAVAFIYTIPTNGATTDATIRSLLCLWLVETK